MYSSAEVERLLNSAVLVEPGKNGKEDTVRRLSTMKYHVPKHLIPADLPLPETCLPLSISSEFKKDDLESGFLYVE